jgi:GNAT superfamily N-acetyltransferase
MNLCEVTVVLQTIQTVQPPDQNGLTLDAVPKRSFLTEISIDHGPAQLLGQFFLRADSAIRARGITLVFGGIDELIAVNEANSSSWGVFAQTLDSRYGNIGSHESYCLLGLNNQGDIVAAQAGRKYELQGRTLQNIADDASLYYGDGPRPRQALSCTMAAPSAATITGRIVYSGALWVHPEYRGKQLAAFLPRVSRAYALARWGTDYTIAFMSPQIAGSPLRASYGYKNVEPGYAVHFQGETIYEGHLAWMNAETLTTDLFEFSLSLLAKVD